MINFENRKICIIWFSVILKPRLKFLNRAQGLVLKVAAQIEFYFSEPNLRRDRNFRKLAGASGTTPVPILKLMKCHKLTELTQDINVSFYLHQFF